MREIDSPLVQYSDRGSLGKVVQETAEIHGQAVSKFKMAPLRSEEEKVAIDDISQEKQMEEFFQWTPHPSYEPETMGQKFRRKTKENPFVPIGKFSKLF